MTAGGREMRGAEVAGRSFPASAVDNLVAICTGWLNGSCVVRGMVTAKPWRGEGVHLGIIRDPPVCPILCCLVTPRVSGPSALLGAFGMHAPCKQRRQYGGLCTFCSVSYVCNAQPHLYLRIEGWADDNRGVKRG